jgi:hypothetical protein
MKAMANNVSDLALDGNTAVRLLQDLFAADITLAQIRCEACNAVQGVGSLATYGTPMGAVLRCSCCANILIRAAQTPRGLWLEMTGARCLKFQSLHASFKLGASGLKIC